MDLVCAEFIRHHISSIKHGITNNFSHYRENISNNNNRSVLNL
jgi:hypothetical protein